MFVHEKSGRPAFLISHDLDVVFSDTPDLARPHHTLPAGEFFAVHREATPEDDAGKRPARASAPRKPAVPKAAKPKAPKKAKAAAASSPPPPPPPPAAPGSEKDA